MLFLRLLTLWAVLGLTLNPATAFPFQGKYLPKSASPWGHKFKLKLIGELNAHTTLHDGNMSVVCHDSKIDIKGADRLGRQWQVTRAATAASGSIYSADLDFDGNQDLIFCEDTGACGIAPSTGLKFVMTDGNGHPTFYEIVGDYQYGPAGIEDLRLIPGVKGAVLIQQYLANDLGNRKNYWKTTAWNAHAGFWKQLHKVGSNDLPEYVLYAFKEHHAVAKPSPKADVDGNAGMIRVKVGRGDQT